MGSAATGFVKNNKKVTWKEFARMLAVLAVPIAMQNLLATTASMVDTIMIGSEGEIAVAAVGVCAQIGSLLFSTYWGFVSCSLLFMCRYYYVNTIRQPRHLHRNTILRHYVKPQHFYALA